MGLSYHFSFRAPAEVPAERLAAFLAEVEGDAKLLGFGPTLVVSGPFDTPERREFAKRVARGLPVEDERLAGADLAPETCWSVGREGGWCRVAPEWGVFLVVTDRRGCETVFGFFRYPRTVRDRAGRDLAEVPGGGDWISGNFVDSPDPRYRAIVCRFAEAGWLESELDEFVPAERP